MEGFARIGDFIRGTTGWLFNGRLNGVPEWHASLVDDLINLLLHAQ